MESFCFRIKIILIIFILIFSGCATGTKFKDKPLNIDIPQNWLASEKNPTNNELNGWLDDFNDSNLKMVVHKALEQNPDVLIAGKRIEYARSLFKQTRADSLPEVSSGLKYSRQQSSVESGGKVFKTFENRASLSLDLSWEIDLWGRLKAKKNAAKQELLASESDFKNARLSYAAQTAKAWFLAIEAEKLKNLSKETLFSYEKSDEIITRRFRSGLATALDVRLIRSEKLSALESMEDDIKRADQQIQSLKVLMGEYPLNKMELPKKLPEIQKDIPTGLPSEILKRRPDVIAAEKRILAADYKTIAAEKSLFPSITLTGSAGTSGDELKNLLNLNYSGLNLGTGLLYPVFNGGKLRSEVKKSSIAGNEAWLNYKKSILNAFHEVESLLTESKALEKREQIIKELVEETSGALDKSWDSYLAGESEIITVLNAKRSLINAQKTLISISAKRLTNRINLYLALGGSFENEEERL